METALSRPRPGNIARTTLGRETPLPRGGSYVWNDSWHTMESTVFGHPGQPKTNPAGPFPGLTGVNFGLTFENNGLSAKGVVERGAKK